MKKVKKEKSFSKKYWPVVVYLDDLREVVETMAQHCATLEISSEDYIFESLDDAKEHFGNRPQLNFKVRASDPYSYVEYSRMETELHVSPGGKSAQLFHEVDELMIRQQRHLPFLYSWWMWLPSMVLPLISLAAQKHIGETGSSILSTIAMLFSLWFLYVMYINGRRHSLVKLQRRSELPTFLEQNRNAIVMSVITGLISGGIGYGFAKLKDAPPSIAKDTK
jgi:hypothetical protein